MHIILVLKKLLSVITFFVWLFASFQVKADAISSPEQECYNAHSSAEMISKCSALIQIEPQNVRAYLISGIAKYGLENYNGAIQELSAAIKLLPDENSADTRTAYFCYYP
jgi:tetratricopeptide (TPR) repeat protein